MEKVSDKEIIRQYKKDVRSMDDEFREKFSQCSGKVTAKNNKNIWEVKVAMSNLYYALEDLQNRTDT